MRSKQFTLEAMEQRQLFAFIFGPDLLPAGMALSNADPVPGSHQVTVNFTIKNTAFGWGDAGPFDVTFWHSDKNPAAAPTVDIVNVGTVHIDGLKNGSTYNGFVTLNVQGDVSDNQAAVMMEIDSGGAVDEVNEDNNFFDRGYGDGVGWANYTIEGDLYQNPNPQKPTRGRHLPVNGALNGAIGDEAIGSRDEDIYDVDVTPLKRYMVDIDHLTNSPLDSYVRVFDGNWTLVASNDNGRDEGEAASPDSYAEFTANGSGTYHIVVSNNGNTTGDPRITSDRSYNGSNTALGAYSISVHNVSTRPVVVGSVLDGDATEGTADNSATIRVYRGGSPDTALSVVWDLGGTARYGEDFLLSDARNGASIGPSGVTIAAGQQYVDVVFTAIDDHYFEPTEYVTLTPAATSAYDVKSSSSPSIYIHNNPAQPPSVLTQRAVFDDNAGPRATFDFDQDVSASFDKSDLTLLNVTANQVVPSADYSYAWQGTHLTVTFTGYDNGLLPDADYKLTILGSGVRTAGGIAMTTDANLSFFSLAGDVNRDRVVNFDDLVLVAQHYGLSGQLPSVGNINYSADGKVDFDDLVLLAQHYGKALTNPVAAPVSAPLGGAFGDVPVDKPRGARLPMAGVVV